MTNKPSRSKRIQTKSLERRQAKKQALKETILQAATELFLEHGYEKFSLRQVAEEIGYSPTSIYLHFKNKDELLFMTALAGFKTFGEMLRQAYESTDDPFERILAIGRSYVEFGLEFPVHYRLMFMHNNEMLHKKMPDSDTSIVDSFGILHQTVADAKETGCIGEESVEIFSAMIWSRVHGIVTLVNSVPSFDKESAYAMLTLNEKLFSQALRG